MRYHKIDYEDVKNDVEWDKIDWTIVNNKTKTVDITIDSLDVIVTNVPKELI